MTFVGCHRKISSKHLGGKTIEHKQKALKLAKT